MFFLDYWTGSTRSLDQIFQYKVSYGGYMRPCGTIIKTRITSITWDLFWVELFLKTTETMTLMSLFGFPFGLSLWSTGVSFQFNFRLNISSCHTGPVVW